MDDDRARLLTRAMPGGDGDDELFGHLEPGPVLTADCSELSGELTCRLVGEMDLSVAGHLPTVIDSALASGTVRSVSIDVSGLEFMDSTGFHDFADVYQKVTGRGLTLHVRGAQHHIRRVFEITDLTHMLD